MRKLFMRVVHSLVPWAMSFLKFPSIEAWSASSPASLKSKYPTHLFFFVDGTIMKINAPQDEKTACAFFNFKHGYHGYVFFLAVMPNGQIVYVSGVREGSVHDKTHWNQSGVVNLLKEAYPLRSEEHTFAIGGDKAYPGLERPDGWKSIVTMTAEVEEDGMKDKVDFFRDSGIARFRAVVERTICAVKKWRILRNESFLTKIDGNELNELLLVICALTNYQLQYHGGTW